MVKQTKLTESLKAVGNLQDVGIYRWKDDINCAVLAFHWNADLLKPYDPTNNADLPGVMPANEDQEAIDKRVMLFLTIRNTIAEGYDHLFTMVQPGDARHLYNQVIDETLSTDLGGLGAAKRLYNESTMENTQVTVPKFINLVYRRAADYKLMGGQVDAKDMIVTLLDGLLPEFQAIRTKLYADKTLTQYLDAAKQVKEFAMTEGLMSKVHGSSKGRTFNINTGNSQPRSPTTHRSNDDCHNFLAGRCTRGSSCKYKHDESKLPKRSQPKKGKSNDKKLRCRHCNKNGHDISDCFRKRREDERRNQLNANKHLASMMAQGFDKHAGYPADYHIPPDLPDLDAHVFMVNCLIVDDENVSGSDSDVPLLVTASDDSDDEDSDVPLLVSCSDDSDDEEEFIKPHVHLNNVKQDTNDEEPFVEARLYNVKQEHNVWVSDSGTNKHATNDAADFEPTTVRTINLSVKTGKGHATATKVGDVHLVDANTGKKVTLKDVIYLPECGCKLISEPMLDKAKWFVYSPGNGTRLIGRNGHGVLLEAKLNRHNLYAFSLTLDKTHARHARALYNESNQAKPLIPPSKKRAPSTLPKPVREAVEAAVSTQSNNGMAAASTSSTAEARKLLEVHRIMMHANFSVIRKLMGLPASTDNPICDECTMAKAKWMGMPDTASIPRAQRVLQCLHMDIGLLPAACGCSSSTTMRAWRGRKC